VDGLVLIHLNNTPFVYHASQWRKCARYVQTTQRYNYTQREQPHDTNAMMVDTCTTKSLLLLLVVVAVAVVVVVVVPFVLIES
jgi:hypothetical protein